MRDCKSVRATVQVSSAQSGMGKTPKMQQDLCFIIKEQSVESKFWDG